MSEIGEPRIGHNSNFNPTGAAYVGSAAPIGSTVTVVPPQAQPGMRAGEPGRKKTGLLPAHAGARFPVVIRDNPGRRIDPRKVATLRSTVTRLQREERAKRTPWVESTQSGAVPGGDPKLRADYQTAVDALAAAQKELAEAESLAKGRPTQVRMREVREPSTHAHAFDASYPAPRLVCLHDRCAGDEWENEGEMRRAHPTNAEMAAQQQAHVFAYYSEAPLDPADPEGERVGLVAPIGSDGSTVASVTEQAATNFADADEVAALRDEIASLRAAMAEMAGKAPAKGGKA